MAQHSPTHILPHETDTIVLGQALAKGAQAGDVICLYGDLGAGKSVLARAFVRALCGADTDVPSPTFTLMQTYDAPNFEIIHADLYRLENPHDIIEIGLDEVLDDAVTLIEWPSRMGNFLPPTRLDIHLAIAANEQRRATLTPHGTVWESRLGQ